MTIETKFVEEDNKSAFNRLVYEYKVVIMKKEDKIETESQAFYRKLKPEQV
jgi:hypothetical protein